MKKQSNTPRIPILIHALLAIICVLVLVFTVKGEAPEEVVIRGWLHADGRDLSMAQVVVEVNNEICVRSIILRNGRFEFSLPVGTTARLVFEEPGSLTKEVLVDTRNALSTTKARKANKLVKFDVVLDPVEKHTGRIYARPVGQLRFVKGSGVMIVKHDVQLMNVPAEE